MIAAGGAIARATRRLLWPGEAAVVVSVVHLRKGVVAAPMLDERQVRRISAYLVEGDLDSSPAPLAANSGKAFQGSITLGMGFTFDDVAAARGEAESLETMRQLIAKEPRNVERIFPYIGGEEVNNSPTHTHHRYVIDFFDRPLRREFSFNSWFEWSDERQRQGLREGIVPGDFPYEVAEDWPDLIEIVHRRVKPERDSQKRDALRERWWQYAEKRPGLYGAIASLERVFATNAQAAPQYTVGMLNGLSVYANSLNIFAFSEFSALSVLQSTVHEVWARFFSSSMKDDLRYNPTDCFRTFPFPENFEKDPTLEAAGEAYHKFRAQLMVDRSIGLTKTYNRFHDAQDQSADIKRLRELHQYLDVAVLSAYGWEDLAARAAPEFLTVATEAEHCYQGRLFWPAPFREEVLARLLDLNRARAEEERHLGLTRYRQDADDDVDESAE